MSVPPAAFPNASVNGKAGYTLPTTWTQTIGSVTNVRLKEESSQMILLPILIRDWRDIPIKDNSV